jgi:tetratricopeptide (TPR) repeat protein
MSGKSGNDTVQKTNVTRVGCHGFSRFPGEIPEIFLVTEVSMRSFSHVVLLAGLMALSWPLAAQQEVHSCSSYSIIIGSPEDKLMLAVNGSDDPSARVAALEKFVQENASSNYLPCAEQLLTKNYVTLKQYDQAIAAGEKAVAAGYLDVPFIENLLQAYMASGKGAPQAMDLIMKAAPVIQAEANPPRNAAQSDADYEAAKKSAAQQAQNDISYMVYAFFRILPGITDPAEKIKVLDQFSQTYPDGAKAQAGQLNYQYALAYTQSNQPDKADEYAEKAIGADPNNIEAMELVAYDYALRRRTNQAKAEDYAKKVLTLLPQAKKPEGISDDQFKAQQNLQEGMARLVLGYLELEKFGPSHRTATAIKQLQQAAQLLQGNPELQGEAYYFLGYSYEALYPPQHHQAMAALEHALSVQNSMQAQARELLAKIKRAMQ